MPQMSPMDWFMLMVYFFNVYLMFLVNFYFLMNLIFKKKIKVNYNFKYLNKWY